MWRTGMWILLSAVLSACMTPAERIEEAKADAEYMVKIYGPACDKLGFSKDTDPWRACLLQMRAHDDERFRALRPSTTNCVGQRGFYHCTSF